jgi:hypothetical protein
MNEINAPVTHPIAVGQRLTAKRPQCPCKGSAFTEVTGTVGKAISNQTGWWYYLSDVGVTVRGEWVKSVNK